MSSFLDKMNELFRKKENTFDNTPTEKNTFKHSKENRTQQSEWFAGFDGKCYTAISYFSSIEGTWTSVWLINKEIYDALIEDASRFEYSEDLIRTGKELYGYKSLVRQNTIEEEIYEKDWKEWMGWYPGDVDKLFFMPVSINTRPNAGPPKRTRKMMGELAETEVSPKTEEASQIKTKSEQPNTDEALPEPKKPRRPADPYAAMKEICTEYATKYRQKSNLHINEKNRLKQQVDSECDEIQKLHKSIAELQEKRAKARIRNDFFRMGGIDRDESEFTKEIKRLEEERLRLETSVSVNRGALASKEDDDRIQTALSEMHNLHIYDICKNHSSELLNEYPEYSKSVMACTNVIRNIKNYPWYQNVVDEEDKKIIDSHIIWADIQHRIEELFLNPGDNFVDGRYVVNPGFRALYEDVKDGVAASYEVNERAKDLKGLKKKTTYAEFLIIVHRYIKKWNYLKGDVYFDGLWTAGSVPVFYTYLRFQSIVFNQFLKACRDEKYVYPNDSVYDDLNDMFQYHRNLIDYWNEVPMKVEFGHLLWDGIEIEEEEIETLFHANPEDYNDEKRYVVCFLQWTIGAFGGSVENIAEGTYLYELRNYDAEEESLTAECKKILSKKQYALRKSLSVFWPDRLWLRIAFYEQNHAEEFMREAERRCQEKSEKES